MNNIMEKIKILASSAKYDISCSSSGSRRKSVKGKLGSAHLPGVCHSWSEDGRCISLLKILLSNDCIYDCKYCINRVSHDFPRATFEVEELVKLTIDFYRRNYIEGLFLSSAVVYSPDYTMERMISVVKILREREGFNGYIHLKTIPGADVNLIEEAGRLADRMSVNTELPSSKSLALMAPQKTMKRIITPMRYIKSRIEEQQSLKSKLSFVPAGQTTQVIIGATEDTDYDILNMSEYMYQKQQLKRVYYSAFVPLGSSNILPSVDLNIPTAREHRLYQADWLLRFYGFQASELLSADMPHLDVSLDPKAQWAVRHLDAFPIEVNTATLHTLLRIPGIGPLSARRILEARRYGVLSLEGLKHMGVVLKRAVYFITINGKYYAKCSFNQVDVHRRLLLSEPSHSPAIQLSLLDMIR